MRAALVLTSSAAALVLTFALPAQASSFTDAGGMSENFRTEDTTSWTKVGSPNTWNTPFGIGSYQSNHVTLGSDGLQATVDGNGSGEYRTNPGQRRYGYGVYTVRFKPSATRNLMSGSFFTYVDNNDIPGRQDKVHDEIDFEFFTDNGRDTTTVQTNYFVHDIGHSEQSKPLGFDASQGLRTYSFDWRPDSITWYVEGQQIRKVTGTPGVDIPSEPGMIIANIWPMGGYDNTSSTAVYDSVTFTPAPVFDWQNPNDPWGGGVVH